MTADFHVALLDGYPSVVTEPVLWGDMDAFGHVNNRVYLRYFESSRMAYFRAVGYPAITEATGLGPILAATQCRFRIPLTHPDQIHIGARVESLDRDRFTMRYIVISEQHQAVAAEGDGLIVSFDYRNRCKTPLPDGLVKAIRTHDAGIAPAS